MPTQADQLLATLDAAAQAAVILSPSAIYLELDDELRVTAFNAAASVQLEIRSRILGIGRKVQVSRDFLTPATTRAATSAIVSTDEGWLIGGEIVVGTGAPAIGQCYVVVEIVRGLAASAQQYQAIAAGYVTAKVPLGFPGVPLASPLDGAGALRSIVGTQPAAGADLSETVPAGARWEVLSFAATLVTAVAAANRVPVLILDDGTNNLHLWPMQGNETASANWQNHWAQGGPSLFTVGALTANGFIPIGQRLAAGGRIRTTTLAIQAADQWSTPKYLVREWIEGA